MKRLPLILFCFLMLASLVFLLASGTWLPERVASHFNASGVADGWMERSRYLRSAFLLTTAAPVFIVGILWAFRFIPISLLSLPHKALWSIPELRATLDAYFLNVGCWLGIANLSFILAMQALVVQANRQPEPRLESTLTGLCAGVYLLFNVIIILISIIRFLKPPKLATTA